jgi:hypothetical protein
MTHRTITSAQIPRNGQRAANLSAKNSQKSWRINRQKITLDADDGVGACLSGAAQNRGVAGVVAFVLQGNVFNHENGIFQFSVALQGDSVSR